MALVFAWGVLATSVIRTSAQTASENYKIAPLEAESTQKLATETAKKEVNYFLVYPGILPDHFLYPIKMIRDRVWLWLTTDPLKKAELLLLFADKRLGAAKALIEGNKVELGISTMTKAEKYLERAVSQERVAAQKDKQTAVFLEKLSLASLKHEEVLLELYQKVSDEFKPVVNETLGYARWAQEKVRQELEK